MGRKKKERRERREIEERERGEREERGIEEREEREERREIERERGNKHTSSKRVVSSLRIMSGLRPISNRQSTVTAAIQCWTAISAFSALCVTKEGRKGCKKKVTPGILICMNPSWERGRRTYSKRAVLPQPTGPWMATWLAHERFKACITPRSCIRGNRNS
jgi:hypothetical protein